jgi:hypothetical protein
MSLHYSQSLFKLQPKFLSWPNITPHLLAVDIASVISPSHHTPPIYNIEYQEEQRKDAEECHICVGVALPSTRGGFSCALARRDLM